MDESVLRGMAKWPNVPDVYGWLSLDRRGNWRLRGEPIGHPSIRAFIGRNYGPDARGRWHFQNGPQRVFVSLAYAPLVVRWDGEAFTDHCDRPFAVQQAWLDDEGSLLLEGAAGGQVTLALLDDRDLARYADGVPGGVDGLPVLARAGVPERFGFVPEPAP